jgi:hypothetical protein
MVKGYGYGIGIGERVWDMPKDRLNRDRLNRDRLNQVRFKNFRQLVSIFPRNLFFWG